MALSAEPRETFFVMKDDQKIKVHQVVYVVRCDGCCRRREFHMFQAGMLQTLRDEGWSVYSDSLRHLCPTCKPILPPPSRN